MGERGSGGNPSQARRPPPSSVWLPPLRVLSPSMTQREAHTGLPISGAPGDTCELTNSHIGPSGLVLPYLMTVSFDYLPKNNILFIDSLTPSLIQGTFI